MISDFEFLCVLLAYLCFFIFFSGLFGILLVWFPVYFLKKGEKSMDFGGWEGGGGIWEELGEGNP